MITVPRLGARYWAALSLASIFGADLGDYFAHALHLGHWRGLPVLAVLFALTTIAARRRPAEAWYWAGIILVRTAATNFADLQTHDIRLPMAILLAAYAALLAALVTLSRRDIAPGAVPRANLFFWASMLVAGTLGTVAGDDVSGAVGTGVSSAIWTGALAAGFAALPLLRVAPVIAFWVLVVLVRSWGTAVGDFAADTIGLEADLAASGAAFVALLCLWPAHRRVALVEPATVAG